MVWNVLSERIGQANIKVNINDGRVEVVVAKNRVW